MDESRRRSVSQTIDVGRAVAVSAIFYLHVGYLTHYPLSRYGGYAVGFFVVVAGIAYVAFSRTQASDLRSYFQYLASRIAALFPIFLAVNLLLFAASYVHPSELGRPFTFSELVLGCLGIGEYLGYRALSQVMWFVPFVLQVYALLPLMNWLVARVYPAAVLIAAFGLTLLVTTAVYAYWPAGAADISCRWSPVFRLAEVCLGVFLGRCLARRRRPSGAIAFAALYLAVSGAFVLLRDGEKYSSPIWLVALPWSGLIVGALITLTSVLLLLVLRRIAPRLNYRLLGAASFPFFLIHAAGIQTVYGKFGANAFVWLAYYVLCWAAAFVLATLDRQWRMLVLARPVGRQSAQAAPATNSFPASTAPPAVPQSAHDAKTLR